MNKKFYHPSFRHLLPIALLSLLMIDEKSSHAQVLINESFNGTTIPAGWVATDDSSSGTNWVFDNPGSRLVNSGATNMDFLFAILDSDYHCNEDENATLETPSFDASVSGNYRLKFDNSFLTYSGDESAVVEVWNGTSWVTVFTMLGSAGNDGYPIANQKSVDITAATNGSAAAKVRFRYINGNCDWYWIVDNVIIERLSCTAPSASFTYVPDCSNESYSVEVNVSNLGTATSVSLSENGTPLGSAITTPGVITAGPFASGTTHHFTLHNDQDATCNITIFDVEYYCTAANLDCSTASSMTVGTTGNCSAPIYGEIVGQGVTTEISDCASEVANSLWYSFQATQTSHVVSLSNIQQLNNVAVLYDYGVAMYSGTCGALTEIDCSIDYAFYSPPVDIHYNFQGLTVGETYYIQVWADEAYDDFFDPVENNFRFKLCVGEIEVPVNDECVNAINISNATLLPGNNFNATQSMPVGGCGWNTANDVWYYFVPESSGTILISANSDADLVIELLTGNCGSMVEIDCDYIQYGSTLSFGAVANEYYYIRVYGYDEDQANFGLQIFGGVPLPVTMDALKGTVSGSKAQLQWRSLTEINNKGFEIQRAEDGRNFRTTGFVSSLAKGGNSTEPISYSFTDPLNMSDVAYYRLRQVDQEGTSSYSNIVRLVNDASGTFDFRALPNPARNSVTLHVANFGEGAVVTISDIAGKTMRTIPVTQVETAVDVSDFAAGIYLVRYDDGSQTKTIKLTKQ